MRLPVMALERIDPNIVTKRLRSAPSGSSRIETTTDSRAVASESEGLRLRLKKLMLVIERLHIEYSLPTLEDLTLGAKAGLWEEHLTAAGVPTDRLEDCYRRAVSEKADVGNSYPPNHVDLICAWQQMRAEEARKERRRREQNPCPVCFNADWVATEGDGGRYATLPCPECRPAQHRTWLGVLEERRRRRVTPEENLNAGGEPPPGDQNVGG
jgi:hypothetical protein